MGYIREPKNVDLVVGPSVFTDETRNKIIQAIAQYKKTGEKPVSIGFATQGSIRTKAHISRAKSNSNEKSSAAKKRAKI
jgi:hypothetical protein